MSIDDITLRDMLLKLLELNNSILCILLEDHNFCCRNEVIFDERQKITDESSEVIRVLKHEIEAGKSTNSN